MAGAYEMLAADYDWMFGDGALAHGRAVNLPSDLTGEQWALAEWPSSSREL